MNQATEERLNRIRGFLLVVIITWFIGGVLTIISVILFTLGAISRGTIPGLFLIAWQLWAAANGIITLIIALGLIRRRAWAPDALVSLQLIIFAVGLLLLPITVPLALARTNSSMTGNPLIAVSIAVLVTAWSSAIVAYMLKSRRVARIYLRDEREQLVPGWLRLLPDAAAAVIKRTGAVGFVVLLVILHVVAWMVVTMSLS